MRRTAILMLVSCYLGLCPRLSAELKLEPAVLRLGELRAGPPLRRTIAIQNDGPAPLTIVAAERGCSCLEAVAQPTTLGSGEKGFIHLNLRTLGHKDGPYTWITRLRWRSGDIEKETVLRVEAFIRNEVTLAPSELALHVADRLERDIIVHDRRATPFKLLGASTSLNGVKVQVVDEGAGRFRLNVQAQREGLQETQRGRLVIQTSDPFYEQLTVPLEVTRVDGKPIQANPERIRLRPEVGVRTALVRLRRGDDGPLKVSRVEADAGLECTWADNPTGGALLRVRAERATAAASVRVLFQDGMDLVIPIVWE